MAATELADVDGFASWSEQR